MLAVPCDTSRFDQEGFAIVESIVPLELVRSVRDAVDRIESGDAVRERRGTAFAVRNVLDRAPVARSLAMHDSVRGVAQAVLAGEPRITRATLFDKNPDANWKVPWHQDTTIAVHQRIDVDGFGPWSVKAGVAHVQPPAEILARMITLRIALDDCDETNGPLLVLPGTHSAGLLCDSGIERAKQTIQPVVCTCAAGGIVAMRPLILHSSAPAVNPRRRRILHLEYASEDLPGGLRWNAA